MGYPLRCCLPGQVYFLTIRTYQERFFLHPWASPSTQTGASRDEQRRRHGSRRKRRAWSRELDKRERNLSALTKSLETEQTGSQSGPIPLSSYVDTVKNIVGCWLAKAVEKYRIELHAVVAMGNHIHIVVRLPRGTSLSAFMQYFNGNVARAMNRYLGRTSTFWSRRFTMAPILDEESVVREVLYTLANPQKANLVDTWKQWPGLHSGHALCLGRSMRFVFFDRSKWHRAKKPTNDIRPFLEVVELGHTPPSSIAKRRPDAQREGIIRLLTAREHDIRAWRKRSGSSVVPRSELRSTSPFSRPVAPKRSPQPLCHARDRASELAHRERMNEVYRRYRRSSERFRRGQLDVEFPAGTVPPPLIEPTPP